MRVSLFGLALLACSAPTGELFSGAPTEQDGGAPLMGSGGLHVAPGTGGAVMSTGGLPGTGGASAGGLVGAGGIIGSGGNAPDAAPVGTGGLTASGGATSTADGASSADAGQPVCDADSRAVKADDGSWSCMRLSIDQGNGSVDWLSFCADGSALYCNAPSGEKGCCVMTDSGINNVCRRECWRTGDGNTCQAFAYPCTIVPGWH